jgi:hypothetical protein
MQPGMAVWEECHDPKDSRVKRDGENVIEFPNLVDLQQVLLKVMRWADRDKRPILKEAMFQN